MAGGALASGFAVGWRAALLLAIFLLSACEADYVDSGPYRVVTAKDGLFGLRCQPRTEFYYLERTGAKPKPVYLGTCSTPRFISQSMGLPSDPSCFAVADDGASIVYLHRPEWCGAGEVAQTKPGGVYRHSPEGGDALLYSAKEHVGQVWSRAEVPSGAMRVSWKNARPSLGGATCSQHLFIFADGRETPIGEPATVHGCLAGRDEVEAAQ